MTNGAVILSEIVFAPNASAYSLALGGNIVYPGVRNNSGINQNISANGELILNTGAGDNITYTVDDGDEIAFYESASAQTCSFVCNSGSLLIFYEQTDAGDSHITALPGSQVIFSGKSTAENATITAVETTVTFAVPANGGNARMRLNHGSISQTESSGTPSFSIGSLEGTGSVGVRGTFTLGGNNLSTVFSGLLVSTSGAGKINKIGTGTFDLARDERYLAGISVSEGTLIIDNARGSGSGYGPVQVPGGVLGGNGAMIGPVTVGSGKGTGGTLAPAHGTSPASTLTIQSFLTLDSDSVYVCSLQGKGNAAATDSVTAGGVTIQAGAQFSLLDTAKGKPTSGMRFTVISNTASTPISGTFANLADGGTITVNGTSFQASYEGGDGNDLTLTVQ